jgi:hypothetical protein
MEHIEDEEEGLSVRTKLNGLIDKANGSINTDNLLDVENLNLQGNNCEVVSRDIYGYNGCFSSSGNLKLKYQDGGNFVLAMENAVPVLKAAKKHIGSFVVPSMGEELPLYYRVMNMDDNSVIHEGNVVCAAGEDTPVQFSFTPSVEVSNVGILLSNSATFTATK